MDKKILDVTCGARTMWFDKNHPAAVYCDKRREEYHNLWKNAGNCSLQIAPDVLCDFTNLPFPDESFPLVVFDPPHLTGAKDTATADACRVTLAIFFTALLDKEGMDAEQLQRIWREVEALSESVRDGYVSAPDLIRVLREEYEIDIIGG